jgi:hypothetical protein
MLSLDEQLTDRRNQRVVLGLRVPSAALLDLSCTRHQAREEAVHVLARRGPLGVFVDALGQGWRYEAGSFDLVSTGWYLPKFWLLDQGL